MLMIRLQRIGRTNDPAYRISVLEKARAARAGRIVEDLGSYNPRTKALALDETRAKEWMAQGAEPTDTVRNLLIAKGVMTGKQVDVFPSSARRKAAEAAKAAVEAERKAAADAAAAKSAEAEAAVTAAAAPVAEAAPVEPEAASPEVVEAPGEPETAPEASETPVA